MRKPIWIALIVMAAAGGTLAGHYLWPAGAPGASVNGSEEEPLYWVAPMDPTYRKDKPGKSPMGMDLIPVYPGDEPPGEAEPGVVRISPAVVNNLGVKTRPAERGTLHKQVETVGFVQYDENNINHIHTRVEGWIEKLHVRASGDPVTRGQPLFELYSQPLVAAQQEFLAALRRGEGQLLAASRERLAALGMNPGQIEWLEQSREVRRLMPVTAAADGFVADLQVREGMFVKPDTEVMSIAALDTVWVIAEVFERQVAWLEMGQAADVQFDYLPGRSWRGEVDYIYPELDPDTRTARVRIELPNPGVALKPNMFADVMIHAAEETNTVHVPRQALIRGGRMDRVVLDTGDGRFQAVPVETGMESGDRVEILSGVEAGQSVVVSGQFLIDSEANLGAELLRAGANGAETPDMDGQDHDGHDMDGTDSENSGEAGAGAEVTGSNEDEGHEDHGEDGSGARGKERS